MYTNCVVVSAYSPILLAGFATGIAAGVAFSIAAFAVLVGLIVVVLNAGGFSL